MAGSRVLAVVAVSVGSLLCLCAPASADHTLDHLVSPPGSAPYFWNAQINWVDDSQARAYMSPDGARAILATTEPRDPADTDTQLDLYEAVGGTFQLLTPGTSSPPGRSDFSLNGAVVAFETTEALLPADNDFMQDVYVRAGGVTQLVSVGDFAGSGVFNAYLRDVSEDGSKVFFSTAETIIAADADRGHMDVFVRSGGSTELISTGPQGGDGAHDATFGSASADGSTVFFNTAEALVSQDTDTTHDVYERASGVTTLMSTGPVDGPGDPGAGFTAGARDGSRVVFGTQEQLVPEDTDTTQDLYSRAGGTTTLISTGPADNGGGGFSFLKASQDASVLLFQTTKQLVAGHPAGHIGYYRATGSQTDLVVTYPGSNLTNAPFVLSGDGSHVFFTTKSSHAPEDLETDADIYAWHDGGLELISTGPGDTNTTYAQTPVSSFDGERVFFQSKEPLVPGDVDGQAMDLFERAGGTTYQISPPGTTVPTESVAALSPDAEKLLVSSQRALTPADTDPGYYDMYLFSRPAAFASMWAPALASAAPAAPAAGPAGTAPSAAPPPLPSTGNGKLAFVIKGLVAMVEQDGSGLHYVSDLGWTGAGPAWSADGTRLAFTQGQRIGTVEPDGTNRTWMSELSNSFIASYPAWSPDGQTIAFLWRPPPQASCAGIATTRIDGTESKVVVQPASPCDKRHLAWSPDGETFAFSANETPFGEEIYTIRPGEVEATKLTNEEGQASRPDWSPDGSWIAYDTSVNAVDEDVIRIDADGQNRTVMFRGSAPAWSPDRAEMGHVRDVPSSVYDSAIDSKYLDAPGGRQILGPIDFSADITELDWQPVPGGQKGYPRPKGTPTQRISLVPAYYQCVSPNRTHGPALEFPSCHPPVQGSDHLTIGTPDANGNPALFSGSLGLRPLVGTPSTPADEADMEITASLSDVRCRTAIAPCTSGALSDYTGQLQARFVVRATDRLNALGHAITVQDFPLQVPIACTATPSSTAGSDCATDTTLEALVPGAVPEGKRSNWQIDQLTIFDGGTDGDPGTGVRTPFAVPGIFVP